MSVPKPILARWRGCLRKVLGLSARRVTLGELEQILRRCAHAPYGIPPPPLEQLVRDHLEVGALVSRREFWTHWLPSELGRGLVNLRNEASHGNEVGYEQLELIRTRLIQEEPALLQQILAASSD
jgi:hypothetical protein